MNEMEKMRIEIYIKNLKAKYIQALKELNKITEVNTDTAAILRESAYREGALNAAMCILYGGMAAVREIETLKMQNK